MNRAPHSFNLAIRSSISAQSTIVITACGRKLKPPKERCHILDTNISFQKLSSSSPIFRVSKLA